MNPSIPEKLKGKTYIDPKNDTDFKNSFASKDAIKDFVDGIQVYYRKSILFF